MRQEKNGKYTDHVAPMVVTCFLLHLIKKKCLFKMHQTKYTYIGYEEVSKLLLQH